MPDTSTPPEPPKAWLMAWASVLCLTAIFGLSYSFAAFFENFSQAFSAQRADMPLVFGFRYDSTVPLLPAFRMELFGGKAVSAILGTLYTGAALGNLLGPVLAGKIFDLTRSYALVSALALGFSAIAAAGCWRALQYADQQYE